MAACVYSTVTQLDHEHTIYAVAQGPRLATASCAVARSYNKRPAGSPVGVVPSGPLAAASHRRLDAAGRGQILAGLLATWAISIYLDIAQNQVISRTEAGPGHSQQGLRTLLRYVGRLLLSGLATKSVRRRNRLYGSDPRTEIATDHRRG